MSIHLWRLAGLAGPILLLAACGSADQRRTTRLLDHRMEARMAADVAANRAAVEPLADGVRVTLLAPSLFPNDLRASDDKYPDIRATVIEAMLDPSLMRVRIVDTSTLPDDQRLRRVHNVEQYFAENGLASVLRPVDPPLATPTGPAGLTITINVECPPPHGGIGYGSGRNDPACF